MLMGLRLKDKFNQLFVGYTINFQMWRKIISCLEKLEVKIVMLDKHIEKMIKYY